MLLMRNSSIVPNTQRTDALSLSIPDHIEPPPTQQQNKKRLSPNKQQNNLFFRIKNFSLKSPRSPRSPRTPSSPISPISRKEFRGLSQLRKLLLGVGSQCPADHVFLAQLEKLKSMPVKGKDIDTKEYKDIVFRLSKLAIVRDPRTEFDGLTFLAKSSSKSCNLFLCHSVNNMKDKYVMKVTQMKSRDIVINVESEVRLTSQCNHPNILSFHGAYASDESIFMVTKYCQNGTLTHFMERYKILTEKQISFICQQILSALHYLHSEKHTMHLDIKSDNILVDEHHRFLLSDFGLSYAMDSQEGTFNDLRGTPHWVAPEMLTQEQYNSKVDIWSFGVVVWQLMHEGLVPHHRTKCVAQILEKIKVTYPRLQIGHSWSPNMVDFLFKALDKDPEQRWSAGQLLQHPFITMCDERALDLSQLNQQQATYYVQQDLLMPAAI